MSRKALRLYESQGILPPPHRTLSGYRVYEPGTLTTLTFIVQARRLGFRLDEFKDVVQIRCAGRCPCPHVLELARRKVAELDRTLADLAEVRRGLRQILRSARGARRREAAVRHHIERLRLVKGRW